MEVLINIDVPNVHTALEFYQRATDLRLKRWLFDGTVAELTGASARIFLLQKEKGSSPVPGANLSRDYRRHWTPVHVDLVVADMNMAAQKAISAGAVLEVPIQEYVWGRQACICDPFGHGVCLRDWTGEGYDEVVRYFT